MSKYRNQSYAACVVERRLILLSHLFKQLKEPDACALIADGAGSLAEQLARSVGLRVLRYASRSLIERYGDWVEPWLNPVDLSQVLVATEQQNACLGTTDGWLQYHYPVAPGLPQSPPPDVRVRIESLERVIAHCRNPVVLVLNDAAALMALAKSPVQCLQQHKPMLMLGLSAVPDQVSRQLLLDLERQGYQLLGATMEPMALEGVLEGDMPTACIAYHPDRSSIDTGLVALLDACSPVTESAAQLHYSKIRPYIQNNGFVANALDAGKLLIPIGDVAAENWYPAEYSESDSWRWSGPGRVARLLVPCPSVGDFQLGLHIHGVAGDSILNDMRIFVDGILQPMTFDHSRIGGRFHVPVSNEDRSVQPGWTELVFALPKTLRPNPEDPRKLGVSIDNVTLRWRGQPDD